MFPHLFAEPVNQCDPSTYPALMAVAQQGDILLLHPVFPVQRVQQKRLLYFAAGRLFRVYR
jgi:hypothetical protein